MKNLIDLSHTIRNGLITFKGLPAPLICDYLTREASRPTYTEGTEFQSGRIDMVANSGTYIDCPFHRYADGKDLDAVAFDCFVDLPSIVLRVDHRERIEIGAADFDGIEVTGRAVLAHTGWSEHWATDRYFDNHPFLTAEAARLLRERGAILVGIDSHNIDDTRTRNSRPVHTELLRHEVLIVEHLCNLEQLPDQEFSFSAVPPTIEGMGTFPVRAYARL